MDGLVLAMGVLYIGLTLSYLLLIRGLPDGALLIFFVVVVTWAGDTGAYLAGKTLGRHALAPVISPKKTYEGLAGGLLLACTLALVARGWRRCRPARCRRTIPGSARSRRRRW